MCAFSPDDRHLLVSGVDTRLIQYEVGYPQRSMRSATNNSASASSVVAPHVLSPQVDLGSPSTATTRYGLNSARARSSGGDATAVLRSGDNNSSTNYPNHTATEYTQVNDEIFQSTSHGARHSTHGAQTFGHILRAPRFATRYRRSVYFLR
jgi:hypothetical protein